VHVIIGVSINANPYTLYLQTLSVEYHSLYDKYDAIQDFMKSKGYHMHSIVTHITGFADDFMFIRNDVMKGLDF